jgi:hypothetical protein
MSKPAKCISVKEARQLQTNWKSTRAAYIEKEHGSADTCEFLYSVEELQEFLDYVKSESLKEGITSPGVRIYFAAYDSFTSDKATIFLAPSKSGDAGSENNYNIDPFNFGQGGWPPNIY